MLPRLVACLWFLLFTPLVRAQQPALVTTWFFPHPQYPTHWGLDIARMDLPNPLRWRFVWPQQSWLDNVIMDSNNDDFVVQTYDGFAGAVVRLSRTGSLSTIYSSSSVGPALVAPSGGYVLSTTQGLAHVRADGSGYRLVLSAPYLPQMTWDEDTGDVVGLSGSFVYRPTLLRCNLSGSISTLASIAYPDSWHDVDYDPASGDFIVLPRWSWCRSPYPLIPGRFCRVPRAGGGYQLDGAFSPDTMSFRISPDGDRYAVDQWITQISPDRAGGGGWGYQVLGALIVTSGGCPRDAYYSGVEIDRWRHLAGWGNYSPGSSFQLRISFPDDAGMPYLGAASLSIRPGLSVGSHWIPLNPDPLFVASLTTPQVFSGFSGALSASGGATATFHIPPLEALRGTRVFFTFVSLEPGGGIRKVSNLLGITIGADL